MKVLLVWFVFDLLGLGPCSGAFGICYLETMSSLSRELVFLILQFLDEEKFKEAVHK